jgi:tetratricopeptide (TPR) repeat protein
VAARWYTAALELWPTGDRERPRLLLRLGQARFYAEAAGGELLTEARDGLLASGDREAAAEGEALLGRLARLQGRGEAAMTHARRAATLLERARPSRAKASVLVNLASALLESGQSEKAVQVGRQALAIADEVGLPELRGRALHYIGVARVETGDRGGVDDLEQAAAIMTAGNSPYSAAALANLGAVRFMWGDLTGAFQLNGKRREAIERFGLISELRSLLADRVEEDYYSGSWDAAVRGADQLIAESEAGPRHLTEDSCRRIRGRIRLARGELAGGLHDATVAVELAEESREPQALQPALAFYARALLAAGRAEEAGVRASQLLAMLVEQRSSVAEPDCSSELAIVLQALGRGAELVQLTNSVTTPTPWLQAATAVAAGKFEHAADRYAQIGSLPAEAFAHLRAAEDLVAAGRRAEASVQLQRALAFYRKVRASAYVREAEALLAASA